MGGILSGSRGWRGGKPSTATLPVVRLTHADTHTVDYRAARVRIDGPDHGTVICEHRDYPVGIAFTPLHFGGGRRWLVCPCCQSRRQALYVAKTWLACRECLGLRYESQHENRRQRAFRSADKLREALGWKPGILNPIGKKPSGMHWTTFERLYSELDERTDALLGNLGKWVDRAESRVVRNGARHRF
jgi:hypothetical protein